MIFLYDFTEVHITTATGAGLGCFERWSGTVHFVDLALPNQLLVKGKYYIYANLESSVYLQLPLLLESYLGRHSVLQPLLAILGFLSVVPVRVLLVDIAVPAKVTLVANALRIVRTCALRLVLVF